MKAVIPIALSLGLTISCGGWPTNRVARIPASPEAVESYVEVELWPTGAPRHLVVEDVLEADRSCVPTVRRHRYYSEAGLLVRRELEYARCGVVERRVVELVRAPSDDVVIDRYLYADEDRDGRGEVTRVLATRPN